MSSNLQNNLHALEQTPLPSRTATIELSCDAINAILQLAQSYFPNSTVLLAHQIANYLNIYAARQTVKAQVPLANSPWSNLEDKPDYTQGSMFDLLEHERNFLETQLAVVASQGAICLLAGEAVTEPVYLCLFCNVASNDVQAKISQLPTFAKLLATELQKNEWILQRAAFGKMQQLTKIISKAQTEFILEDDRRKAFDSLLNDVLILMESEYGFIGEVRYDEQNSPYLKAFALTNIAWDQKTRDFYAEHAPSGLEFRNLRTLFGYTLRTSNLVIANNPAQHIEAGGLPPGHPPLNSYLGLPVIYNNQLVAMLGIANKVSGYLEGDVALLQPLLTTIGQLVYATQVRRTQTAIQEKLNNTVEASQLGIWTLDLNTNILEVNARWLDMLGYHSGEIAAVTIDWMRQQMHQDDLIRSRASMLRHLDGKEDYYFSQFRIRHKNGNWVWIQARGRLLTASQQSGQAGHRLLYGVNIDITEQKTMEHKLTKLAEHVPGLVFQFQRLANGKVVFPYAGPAAEKILGLTPEQLQADGAQVFSKIHPQDYPALVESLEDSEKSLKVWKQLFRLSVDGLHYRWLACQSSPEKISDGSIIWHGYIQDMTEEVLLQQELKRAKEQAEQAVATKSSFLANMSHEIRTPMNGVIGMLDIMSEANTDPAQTENISLMRESAYSLLTIIDDILDFSKLEAGKLSLAPVNTVLRESIDRICNMVDFLALKYGVDFYYFVDPKIPTEIVIDPERLRQILVNLLSNAIKFSSKTERKGQVYMNVYLADRQDDELLVSFEVIDNGIGMSADVVQELFQPFTQADASTSRKYGGTGLGLAITQQLVQLMHGVISAKSEAGYGSQFLVTLPLKSLSVVEQTTSELKSARVIFLAQRESMLLQHLASYLRSEGAAVEWFDIEALASSRLTIKDKTVLWIFDEIYSSGEAIRAAELIKQYWPQQSRFLILGRGRRRKLRRITVDSVYIDANVLSKQQFIAAAKAALRDLDPIKDTVKSSVIATKLLRQFHILVLEDNTTNQKVIRQQLQRLGYQVTVADNGVMGLQLATQRHYDLILSDLHMPEMDGYEFISQFRAYEKQYSHLRTPVIALTANIVQDELIRAKDLGMDDYLVKPLPVVQLKQLLEQYLISEVDMIDTETMSQVHNENAAPIAMVESEQLLDTTSLAEMVGKEAVAEILQDYKLSLDRSLELVEQAISERNWVAIKREAHKLKSSSRFIGSEVITECFVELEKISAADQMDVKLIQSLHNQIKLYASRLSTLISGVTK